MVWLSIKLELLRLMFKENIHLLRVAPLMTLRSWVLLIFFDTSNVMEAKAWILKMEKLFDVIDCSKGQKASYATIMLEKEANHW